MTNVESRSRKSSILSIAVTAFVVPGLFATVALPAYAYAPDATKDGVAATQAFQDLKRVNSQTVVVDAKAPAVAIVRDGFSTTSAAELRRASLAATYSSYTGPSATAYLANPPYPKFDLAGVVAVAKQYQGVPYVFGGANPSGFDCSGLVMFVYAQFGVGLPHSVSGQVAAGTAIAPADALPGDLVILPGHDGIYLGGGMFIDSPYPGASVVVRPIYDSNHYFVRIGI